MSEASMYASAGRYYDSFIERARREIELAEKVAAKAAKDKAEWLAAGGPKKRKHVKRKTAYKNHEWASSVGAEGLEAMKTGKCLTQLSTRHGISRQTLLSYMERYHGFIPETNGQRRKVFTPEEIKIALRMREMGASFREIGEVLKSGPNCVRERIKFPDEPIPRKAHNR